MDVKIILLPIYFLGFWFCFFIIEVAYFKEAIFWEAKKHLGIWICLCFKMLSNSLCRY